MKRLGMDEIIALPYEEWLRYLIRGCEERFISYKKLLAEVFRDKDVWPPGDEFVIWFKEFLREMKNMEEAGLKELQLEIRFHREGLNPPFCYPEYRRKNAAGNDRSTEERNKG